MIFSGQDNIGRKGVSKQKTFKDIGLDKRKIVDIFLPIIFSICLGAQKNQLIETVLLSSEYPQHTFWLRNKKNIFLVSTLN